MKEWKTNSVVVSHTTKTRVEGTFILILHFSFEVPVFYATLHFYFTTYQSNIILVIDR